MEIQNKGDQVESRFRAAVGGARPDLNTAVWRKSTRSGPNCDNCVEVAFVDDAIAVRDSKNRGGPALVFTPGEWDAFVAGAKDGEFDRS